jgi:hypothetical protein
MSDTKYCPDCGEDRPISAFYRYPDKRYKSGYRLSEFCKKHQDERDAQRMKHCPDCGAERPASEFYEVADSRYKGGVRLSDYCKQHTNERQKKKIAAGYKPPSRQKRDYKTEEDPEKRRARQRAYNRRKKAERQQATREWEEKNKEKRREYKRQWRNRKKKQE